MATKKTMLEDGGNLGSLRVEYLRGGMSGGVCIAAFDQDVHARVQHHNVIQQKTIQSYLG
jgi:hypothetical protein